MKLSFTPILLATGAFALSTPHFSQLQKRAVDAGIGVELESQAIVFTNDAENAQKASPDKIKGVKGQTVITVGNSGAQASTKEWKLTAEHSGMEANKGIGNLWGEFIVLGEVVKLGHGNAARIGKEITTFLVRAQTLTSPSMTDSSTGNLEA